MGVRKEIKENIETVRDKLNKAGIGVTSLSQEEIVMISQQLDSMIVSYYKAASRVKPLSIKKDWVPAESGMVSGLDC